jgi:hypothetical protein
MPGKATFSLIKMNGNHRIVKIYPIKNELMQQNALDLQP